jgi:2-oxoglutarate ferredoxin oxidoreductase subunit gamma
MILEEYIFAGFGGQGIMTIGQIIAYAGMLQGFNTAWIPSYGPESRGGTANCNVVISDELIGSPHTHHPNGVIVMNAPSFEKFEPMMAPEGVLVINTNLVPQRSERDDLTQVYVPTADIALEVGHPVLAAVAGLGAFVSARSVVEDVHMEKGIDWALPAHRKNMLEMNLKAYHEGKKAAKEQLKATAK